MTTNRVAYVAVTTPECFGLGIAEEHTKGYYPLGTDFGVFGTYDDASRRADYFNERMGLNGDAAADIVMSSMRKDS